MKFMIIKYFSNGSFADLRFAGWTAGYRVRVAIY